jgi:sulfane dehydrogenase subunit SoxC
MSSTKQAGRRRFLRQSGAVLAGLAVGGMRTARGETREPPPPDERTQVSSYGIRSHFETALRETNPAQAPSMAAALTPHQDLVGTITPSGLHFYNTRSHEYPPSIDPRQHRLLIHGLVDRPLILTMDDLKRLPAVNRIHFVECHGNTSLPGGLHDGFRTIQESHGKMSCSEWTGVPLSTLLREAGVQKEGKWVLAESADAGKIMKNIPMEMAMDDLMVAYGQNGEAVRPEQGYPIRLLSPGCIGFYNVKWLRRIKVVDEPYLSSIWEYNDYRPNLGGKALWYNFEMPVKSVITRPAAGHRLPGPGFYEINGLAWSGGGAIRKVEVSTDGGRTWKDAELHPPVLRKAFTRFTLPWIWDGQDAAIQSRSTDEKGSVQPDFAEYTKIWGGPPDYFKKNPTAAGFLVNAIYPWRISRDGSIQNALRD